MVLLVSYPTTIWPNFSQISPGAADIHTRSTYMHNSPKFSYQEERKYRISTVMRLTTPRCQANKVLSIKESISFLEQ